MENAENTKTPIDGWMLIADILRQYPESAYVLMYFGMGCIGCPSSQMETLDEACMVHGIDAEEVVKYVNYELGLTAAE